MRPNCKSGILVICSGALLGTSVVPYPDGLSVSAWHCNTRKLLPSRPSSTLPQAPNVSIWALKRQVEGNGHDNACHMFKYVCIHT
ncbi:hypothetical protein M758_11G002600 [Ceratodon purpureus]|uniref:Secreted protein n=1 Tax=Ceratodon purpureus TaxID=3225 RepID=A0A8T0G9C5_CERPU|nr:hypothetical protein KC19_11G003300 [Ceratodon purpureus]KAG0600042.1 hypothetical protein M758_11G002600 [Ceratodon purpureus]